jgi:hypothetical protein
MKSTYNIKLKYKNSSENGLDSSKQALMGAMVKVENKKNLHDSCQKCRQQKQKVYKCSLQAQNTIKNSFSTTPVIACNTPVRECFPSQAKQIPSTLTFQRTEQTTARLLTATVNKSTFLS